MNMAVEYITSRNMADLIYETIRLMNKPMAHHCMRVSYIMSKMLETKGTYEKYEIADFMMLALLHDIGAFKTDDVRKQLTFEAKIRCRMLSMDTCSSSTFHRLTNSPKSCCTITRNTVRQRIWTTGTALSWKS